MQTLTETPNTIVFSTPGEIDPRSWEIMGCNSKPDSTNPIGQFGTGLKMALAIILRTGGNVTIMSGTDKTYEFGTTPVNFRGKELDVVTCNDKELGFTTELGKNWEIWQAYRELVSNTMDEGGEWGPPKASPYETKIIVTHNEIRKCYDEHDKYFVGKRQPVDGSIGLDVFEGDGTLFYKGVRVAKFHAVFDYNITMGDLRLTEDRTVYNIYDAHAMISSRTTKLSNKGVLRRICTAGEGMFERTQGYWSEWGETMREVVEELWKNCPTKLSPFLAKRLKERNPSLGFSMRLLTNKENQMLKKALELMKLFGYEVTAEIIQISNTDECNVAFVHEDRIYLTPKAYEQGMFYLVTTLLEEHLHTKGYVDGTRSFEAHLMNEIVRISCELHETIL